MPQTGWLDTKMAVFAVINKSKADDAEVAFACRAVDIQLRRDFCRLWPDAEYQPCVFYSTEKDLPVALGIALLCIITDGLADDPDAAAFHSWKGVPYVKIGYGLGELSCLLSHELNEVCGDPTCSDIRRLPDGRRTFHEVCDPLQAWTYPISTTVLGETRDVNVSAFVTEAWFTGAPGPKTFSDGQFRDLEAGEVAEGGYMSIINPDGSNTNVYGALADVQAIEAKQARPGSRLSRRRGR
jgi:hypothetical protein